ncbi:peptide/nickel transport system ATP-binding protein [Angulomicrobium tetraedrale]|uniref:Nickel import system ATP-binding protein NikD n=1 Tax=Ancylobacter tetraedralis TaxID=217068 RepID=A0A839ZAC0_9HYPH|nr:peptide/nickel transport system ATP-binding protein [Ancylobacter tetraedralis]
MIPPRADASLCRLRGLGVRYAGSAQPALGPIDFDIAAGERLAIIGESGSGKSTLARAIAGLLPAGAALTGTLDWPASGRRPHPGRDLGYVFQDPGQSLNPVLTIGEQVTEGARRHLGLSARAARAHAADLLAQVQLPDPGRLLAAYPHQLSGGQRQRVAIAAAIAAGPAILIADEVTSALDTTVQAAIVALLDALTRDRGMTLIFVTHDMALAAQLADRIAVMGAGRLVEAGRAGDILQRPISAEARRLLDAHIDLDTPPLIGEAAP